MSVRLETSSAQGYISDVGGQMIGCEKRFENNEVEQD
jgi:hypothetical protein